MGVLFDVAPAKRALAPLLDYTYPGTDLTPTVRFPNSAARAAQRAALSALINDFDATLATVACLEDDIARIALGLKQRRARIKMALAPVTGLPTETLREIFLVAAANDITSKLHITISHVSSHWRATIIDIAELWTTICHPGMLHECAERTGEQRLHFTPISGACWPHNLEATPEEASRLSTWLLRLGAEIEGRSGRVKRFASSLVEHSSLVTPNTIIITGPETPTRYPSQYFSLSSMETKALNSLRTTQLTEVGVWRMSVSDCNWFLKPLCRNAPLLSRLRFYAIFGDEIPEGDEENFEVVDRSYEIEAPLCCGQIESLTMEGCSRGVRTLVLSDWIMPSLISLKLDSTFTVATQDWSRRTETLSDSLFRLFSRSTRLEMVDLTSYFIEDVVEFLGPEYDGAEYLAPRLNQLRICCPESEIAEFRGEIVGHLESRAASLSSAASIYQWDVNDSFKDVKVNGRATSEQFGMLHCVLTTTQPVD